MIQDNEFPILGIFKKFTEVADELPKSITINYVEYMSFNNTMVYADENFVNPKNQIYKLAQPCFILQKDKYLTLMYKHDINIKNGVIQKKAEIDDDLDKVTKL